ncbi:hypothetical protein VTH06DRAFT_5737 [Thermothelomyces fergusii]
MEGKLIRPLRSQILDLPPSCIEFCPAYPSYFLVGTYLLQQEVKDPSFDNAGAGSNPRDDGQSRLQKQTQSRDGSIIVFRLGDGDVDLVQTMVQPSALLDLRFNPHEARHDICAAVSSTATLALFKLFPDEKQPLKHLNTMDLAAMSNGEIEPAPGEEIIFTSFGWHPSQADLMAVTTSTGHVYLVHLATYQGKWELSTEPLITHALEAWCVVISPNPTITIPPGEGESVPGSFKVYSGGDDSMLRSRVCNWTDSGFTQFHPASKLRGHDAGVTAILPLLAQDDGQELIATGSYDEHIRLFSFPPFGRPKKLAESRLGGGVWRLKLVDMDTTPSHSSRWRARILASCMHAGARILEVLQTLDGDYRFEVLGRFEEHKRQVPRAKPKEDQTSSRLSAPDGQKAWWDPGFGSPEFRDKRRRDI